ncbi:MAG: hypothetical protein AAFY80_06070 [Pseudomonadota bacterium]
MTFNRTAKVVGALGLAFTVSGCADIYSFFDTSPPAAVQTQAVVAPVPQPLPAPVPVPPVQAQVTPPPEPGIQPEIPSERQLILDDIFGGGDEDGGGGGWSG